MAHIIFPLAHIFVAICIGHCALSTPLAIFPLTIIYSEGIDTLPLSCTFAILDCACIDI